MSRRSDSGVNGDSGTNINIDLIGPPRALYGMKDCEIREKIS